MDDILFGNNNKAIIRRLTRRSFHSNKMRNVIAVIAIALTTFLFTAVLTIGLGSTKTIKYNMERMVGSQADALVQGLSQEQFEQLKNNAMFEKVGCWIPVAIMSNTNRLLVEVDYAGGGSNIATDIGGPMIYMSEDNFKEIYKTPTLYGFLFDVEDEYQQEMENYLAQNTNISFSSVSTLRATILGVKNVVLLIGGMIGAIFALVGLINFTNLIMTNIITRRHEFAVMQSIGMTNKQLRLLMILESISYVMRAGAVGILTSCVMGFTLIKVVVENGPTNFMMSFQMTLFPAIIILVFFGVLAFAIPVMALHFFNNGSVVERLRVQE